MNKLDQKGFHVVELVIVLVVLSVIGFVGWRVLGNKKEAPKSVNDGSSEQASETELSEADLAVRWENTSEKSWMALSTPPTCPNPFSLKSPSPQLSKATALLYPGQERRGTFEGMGGNYKPHGGFRFDNSTADDIDVVSPIEGYVYRGSRFLSDGEIQYSFDLVHPCGFMIRLGHLRELSATFQAYADKFPEAKELDSRTERVEDFPRVKAGDVVATSAGYKTTANNTFFDLGVFDLRAPNEASKDAAFQAKHQDDKEHTWYAVCWLDLLPKSDSDFIKSLPPGDPTSGKTSDYCK